MARLSPRNLLYLKIDKSLSESDVKALRASIVKDEHIGIAGVEKATPHEMFNMLEADAKLPHGDLRLLASLLWGLKKQELAKEAEDLARHERGESPRRRAERHTSPQLRPETRRNNKRIKLETEYEVDCTRESDSYHRSATQPPDEGGGMDRPKRVFISYSMDPYNNSDPYRRDADIQLQRRRVRSLADELRRNGVDCMIDQYVEYSPPDMWTTWMQNEIVQADYVLMVCSPHYLECITGQKSSEAGYGHNASFEGKVIFGLLSNHESFKKFLPVFFEEIDRRFVPAALRGCHMYGPIEYPARHGQEAFDILLSKILDRVPTEKRAPRMGKPPSTYATV